MLTGASFTTIQTPTILDMIMTEAIIREVFGGDQTFSLIRRLRDNCRTFSNKVSIFADDARGSPILVLLHNVNGVDVFSRSADVILISRLDAVLEDLALPRCV